MAVPGPPALCPKGSRLCTFKGKSGFNWILVPVRHLGWCSHGPPQQGCSERNQYQPTTVWQALFFRPRTTEFKNSESQVLIPVLRRRGMV